MGRLRNNAKRAVNEAKKCMEEFRLPTAVLVRDAGVRTDAYLCQRVRPSFYRNP